MVGRVGDAPKRGSAEQVEVGLKEKQENQTRPLDGIRALDLSRVLAGPIAGKTLAGSFFFPYNFCHSFILIHHA